MYMTTANYLPLPLEVIYMHEHDYDQISYKARYNYACIYVYVATATDLLKIIHIATYIASYVDSIFFIQRMYLWYTL